MRPGKFKRVACGGTCVDGATAPNYTCTCPKGYSGNNCQTNDNDCDPNPCNGGNCTDKVAGFTCSSCPAGYGGTTCSTDTPVFRTLR